MYTEYDRIPDLEATSLKKLNRGGLVDILIDEETQDVLKYRLTCKFFNAVTDLIDNHDNTEGIHEKICRDVILEMGFIKDEDLEDCTLLLTKMFKDAVSDFWIIDNEY